MLRHTLGTLHDAMLIETSFPSLYEQIGGYQLAIAAKALGKPFYGERHSPALFRLSQGSRAGARLALEPHMQIRFGS